MVRSVPRRYTAAALPDKGKNHIHYPPHPVDMNRAKSIVANNGGCCGINFNCFTQSLTLPDAARIIYMCRKELQNTESKAQLIDKLREKVNQCVTKVRKGSKYLKMEYTIVTELKADISMRDYICRNAFMEAWGINLSLMKVLRKEIKQDIIKTSHAITNRYSKVTGDFSKLLESTGLNDVVDVQKLYIAKLPQTEAAHHCYNWLENHFKLSGDNEPNSNEIHLDTVNKKDIYAEYVDESILYDFDPLRETQFNKIWQNSFPYVKIRKYKACSGKCSICAELSILTGKYKIRKAMEYIKICRVIHRADFMADRNLYQQRKKFSEMYPNLYMSLITDGMQQTHCELPYSGNKVPSGVNKLKQHLQGITTHYRRTRMFRTLDHIHLGSNTCIYTLLCALEEAFEFSGKLPKTLYIQIDGGSENANYAFLAWMEIIISLDLGVEEIWVCRLRVGHNHADQDGKFGQLWKAARNEYLLTPQSYEDLVARAIHEGKKTNPAKLVDAFVIPDLVAVIEECIDPELQHAFKGVYTQHVFRFQKVPVTSVFPMGSKCTYRASALDEFYEFIDNPESPIGKSPRKVLVEWHPIPGMRILTKRPINLDNIRPHTFVDGAVEHMRHVISAIIATSVHPDFVKDWELFQELLPLVGESPEDFINRGNELHIPFRTLLSNVGKVQSMNSVVAAFCEEGPRSVDYGIILPEPVMAGACLKSSLFLKPEPARVTIDGRHDATRPEQKPRRSTKIRRRFDAHSIVEG